VLSVLLEGWPEALACRCPLAEGDTRARIQNTLSVLLATAV